MRSRHLHRRQRFIVRALALLAACALLQTAPRSQAASQPNVIVIISDDAGYNDFGFMPAITGIPTDIRTPNLDALAAQSTILSMAYTSGTVCSPSRAALLTGQYQQRFGHEDNPNALTEGLPAGQQLITHHLKQLGYTTGMVGKWHLGNEPGVSRPLDVGFDEFYGLFGGGRPYWGLGATDEGRTLRRGNENIEHQWVNEGLASRYDPVNGRYLTDAFGEEAVDFINRHAADQAPFFLYAALPAPHTPFDAKQSDMDQFANIPDIGRRAIAAMTYAMDRAVGDMMAALSARGIDDNTIVVFLNDNGGPAPSVGDYNNGPLRGSKGSVFEGGIRVPFTIKAPGLAPGVYDRPISALDVLPTLVNAAGGDASLIDTNGVNVLPYLAGDAAGDPHEYLFWRGPGGRFAVRKGDWKLVRPPSNNFTRLHNTALDISETTTYNAEHPELVGEMLRQLTVWETGLAKAKWGALGSPRNRFDHFVHSDDSAAVTLWSASQGWKQAGTENRVTFISEDAYANAILEFKVRNDAPYTSTNDMTRMTMQTFMLNQLRFTGDFSGAVNHSGTINGNALLFVNNLQGGPPQIRLDALSTATANRFSFRLDNELQLYDDLEITGDGTESFEIHGNIRDFDTPRTVIKSGASSVTLAGDNAFAGPLVIQQGRVSAARLAGALRNLGGSFAPNLTPAVATIGGDFEQQNGTLEIEIGGAVRGLQYDALAVAGNVILGGTLKVSLTNGYAPTFTESFDVLDWGGSLTGTFANVQLPEPPAGFAWNTDHLYDTGLLRLIGPPEPGDFNADTLVDAADYVAWRKEKSIDPRQGLAEWAARFGNVEPGLLDRGDFNGDYAIDAADYVAWRKGAPASATVDYQTWISNFAHPRQGPLSQDWNADGKINAADYIVWRKGWDADVGEGAYRDWWGRFSPSLGAPLDAATPAAANVPEPTAAMLILATLGALLASARKRLKV